MNEVLRLIMHDSPTQASEELADRILRESVIDEQYKSQYQRMITSVLLDILRVDASNNAIQEKYKNEKALNELKELMMLMVKHDHLK